MTERYDPLMIRCPRLGGEVTFGYCRIEGGSLPCMRIVACWQSTLPIEAFLKEALTPEHLERFMGEGPKDKVATLLELIESAKKEHHE